MNTELSSSVVTECPVWIIIGCSTGFGLELAKRAIEHGCRTGVAARGSAKLPDPGATGKRVVLKFDVTKPDQTASAVAPPAPQRQQALRI